MNTSEKIKMLRLEKGFTQEELARMVGVQKAAVNKWETGRVVNIKKSTLKKLAEVLGVSPVDLLDDDEPEFVSRDEYYLDPEVAQMAQELASRPEMQIMFDASRNLTKEDIEVITALIEKMSRN